MAQLSPIKLWIEDSTGTNPTGASLPSLGVAWTPSIGNFEGNGKADIFWHNTQTGENQLWALNGTNVTQTAEPSLPAGWTNYTHA